MKFFLAILFLCLFLPTTVWGHGSAPDQQMNRLHFRISETGRDVDMAFWIAVAAYLTAAVACGAVCTIEASRNHQNMRVWFVAGVLLPIIAVPAVFLMQRDPMVAGESQE